ncbi:unnamed protein product, partial [Heligmosomoides polygyrus]|uniref:Tyrosine-protein phosphatase domain-containing protein n=1 Tax=Heligmosomoides polygyrus TaxID=6339 RepID=A0A183FG74_HELPZ
VKFATDRPSIERFESVLIVHGRQEISDKTPQTNVLTELHKQVNEKPSSFDDFLEHPNLNRFPNVLCLDRSRVRVSKAYGTGDYCHASYVDSLEQKNGYILSQAPFSSETEELFWRMVLDAYPKIILVLGSLSVKTIESKLEKRTGPTVLVCPSGATRCGTYAAVDVILSRILKEKRVNLFSFATARL